MECNVSNNIFHCSSADKKFRISKLLKFLCRLFVLENERTFFLHTLLSSNFARLIFAHPEKNVFCAILIFAQLIGNIVLRSLIFAHYLLHKELCQMRHILHVKIIFFRLEAIIVRTFFERRSIVIFLTLNMFLHTLKKTCFAHPSCAKIVGLIFAHLFCAKITVTRNLGKVRYVERKMGVRRA